MKRESTVLIVQDTTELNFSSRPGCEGLGAIGTNQTGAQSRGLDWHSSLAVGESGLPLGVLRLHGYAPQGAQGKDRHRPIEQKESYRWVEAYEDACRIAQWLPQTRLISVADREGDMFELFDRRRCRKGPKADLLVRAKHDRCLEGSDRKLFEELAARPVAKTVAIPVPRQRERAGKPSAPGRVALPARVAKVQIRFKEVSLSAPQTSQGRHKAPVKLWAVYLLEKYPPKGAAAVRWLLLTTVPILSVKQALKCVGWYCRRWRIEEWHRVMKSGCRILGHQNHRAEVLLRAIALDAVIGWRLMLLGLLGREVPELPAGTLFDRGECEVLGLLTQKKDSRLVRR
jgi:hypothetical protein